MQIAEMIDGPIRMVTFDLFDTLVVADPPGWVRFQKALTLAGLGDVPEIDNLRAYAIGQEFYTQENTATPIRDRGAEGILSFRRAITRVTLEALGLPADDETVQRVQGHFQDESQPNKTYTYVAFPEVQDVLKRLHKQKVLLGVISNADNDVTRLCLQAGFAEQMDIIVTSALVGWEKPDPRTFYAAIEPFNIPAGSVLHVGDQIGSDVIGSRAVGMAAALLDRYDHYTDDAAAAERVTSLMQLAEIVEEYNDSFA
ncbi:MAG: HAD-IA family hydrolase [Thermomicrobiales bacterium]|nr:HAD-IA family hydrolase [Thermomicrobiales bacterium]